MLELNTEQRPLNCPTQISDIIAMLESFEKSPYYPGLDSWCTFQKPQLYNILEQGFESPQVKQLIERSALLLGKWQLQTFSKASAYPIEAMKIILNVRAYLKLSQAFTAAQWVDNGPDMPPEVWCMWEHKTIRVPLVDIEINYPYELDSIMATSCSLRDLISCIARKIEHALLRVPKGELPVFVLLVSNDNFGWLNARALTPYFFDTNGQTCLLPGIFWNAMFGTEGSLVPSVPSQAGSSAIECELDFNGVFAGSTELTTPAVSILQSSDDRVFSLYCNHYSDIQPEHAEFVLSCIKQVSDYSNDSENTQGSKFYDL